MCKKRALVYIIALVVVAGSSACVYTSKNSVDYTKNIVKSTVIEEIKSEDESKITPVSDEEAISFACEISKEYFNVDLDESVNFSVTRQDWTEKTEIEVEGEKYIVSKDYAKRIKTTLNNNNIEGAKIYLKFALKEVPNIVKVSFKSGKNGPRGGLVEINSDTKDILSAEAFIYSNVKKFVEEVDKDKLKEANINFLSKINKEADEESILEKYVFDNSNGIAQMSFKLKDGGIVSTKVNLKDYSVAGYTADYLRYPE